MIVGIQHRFQSFMHTELFIIQVHRHLSLDCSSADLDEGLMFRDDLTGNLLSICKVLQGIFLENR